ncbi:hypothetical protein P43SY_002325 [Pythium insidiosum]|uniref:RNase III domain-containing protein n=1 Tax=Pythium insidiosum TaxID=114742 RepID=A0AAD5LQP1_PYTIN|nr:hypothetical protein P43SY_002325 [Pythium insidiosum]
MAMRLLMGWRCSPRWRAAIAVRHRALSTQPSASSAAPEQRMARQLQPTEIRATPRLPTRCLLQPDENDAWKIVTAEHLEHAELPADWLEQLDALQERIGVRFRDVTHLQTALIHHGALAQLRLPSDVATQRLSNRSLEFLGDSVLGMAVASHVFQSQPRFQEGQLTRFKSILVNNDTLSKVAVHDLQIDRVILVARDYSLACAPQDQRLFDKGRKTIQAGAVEALIAAVYVDQGLETALAFVNDVILPSAIKYATVEHTFQAVVELQNLLQAHGYGHPRYE